MDKVGIITLMHVRNIGAVLQAYATKCIIEEAGFEPIFIRAYGIGDAIRFFIGDMGMPKIYNLKFMIKKLLKFNIVFKSFRQKKIKYSKKCKVIVLGSDSIWIPYNRKKRMPKAFFGDVENNNVISFSASTGGINDENLYSSVQKEALMKIKEISVRDIYTQNLLKKILDKDVDIILDPTLLIDWESLISNMNIKREVGVTGKFILVYGGISTKYAFEIKKIAKQLDYQVVNVGTYSKEFKINIAVSPFEFLLYVRDAAMIFSSMFHGIMISFYFEKTFRYIPMDKNRNKKLESMVEILEMDKNFDIYMKLNSPMEDYKRVFNYNNVNEKKSKLIMQSKEWLMSRI